LQAFLLELGKGYTFVGRQVCLPFDEKHFFCGLVFFNHLLQCFVLVDLKIGETQMNRQTRICRERQCLL